MQIAIASGKGGTGKTTIATSLAKSLADDYDVYYIDCDVEAPDGHLFLQPQLIDHRPTFILIPQIDRDDCTFCGQCVSLCQFHALVQTAEEILVFPQLCHGCGSCTWNCPQQAIIEVENTIGLLESGSTPEGIHFMQGLLNIGEPMATPIIRQLRKQLDFPENSIVILDAPPGASCSVVETIRGVDFVILVTEPTPFGKHDLLQIIGILKDFDIPAGVIINRTDGIESEIEKLIKEKQLPILMRIPFETSIAAGIASGSTLVEIQPAYRNVFVEMVAKIKNQISKVIE